MAAKTNWVDLLLLVAAAALLENAAATTYYVGDSLGWQVPPGGSATYSNWASQHTFFVGDILFFNFTTGQHTAAQVTVASFNSCNTANYITLQTTGPANYTLNTTGPEYFICVQSNHCSQGQKLQVNVTSTSGYPGSPPSPPPPPPSSAPSTANIATFSIIFMSIAVAFLC
ncbi:hypothetical protein F0562_030119 [Nyssa sinensis]|uniref:Phytocyanin domain-containing protein n=1 Tax=Nyssa sinensis TaxID=561372 RepID=A0A5J5AZ51_9ASTE|nr:hypothetical protein F0562_030119 [Nyssa sinensis]